mmetsp:Transcript_61321/g.146187  ORF Transcript_61321/g.146187 Transcript_61321/m.146187 type:complete len:242 (-) Transcript_61321:244-969(-)
MSCCFSWSEVGFPRDFCLWSYIIFSTVMRVSPSKSESLEFSGTIFLVSMPGSPSITQFHHFMLSNFSKVICTTLLSMRVHMQSSGFTLECILPFKMRGSPLMPSFSVSPPMSQMTCFAFTPGGTGTKTSSVLSVWVQLYLSVLPPLPGGGGSLSSFSSSSFSSSPSAFLALLALILSASSSVTSSILGSFFIFSASSCRLRYSSSSCCFFSSAFLFLSSSATRLRSCCSCRLFWPAFQCFL